MLLFHGLWSLLMTCLSLLRHVMNCLWFWPSHRNFKKPMFSFFYHCERWRTGVKEKGLEKQQPVSTSISAENCMAVYSSKSMHKPKLLCNSVTFSMFDPWFQTGNAWIIIPKKVFALDSVDVLSKSAVCRSTKAGTELTL